jgi:short-subunit dehydrogenase
MTSSDDRPWAIVTGASEGIGEVFAQHLDKRETHNVVLVARTKAKLEKVASKLANVKSLILVEDLSAPGAAERVLEKTKVSSSVSGKKRAMQL